MQQNYSQISMHLLFNLLIKVVNTYANKIHDKVAGSVLRFTVYSLELLDRQF